jgi:hypothetical protein
MQLTIHALHGEPSTDDAPRFDTSIKLCFPVDAIAETRARAATLGGTLWDIEKEWEARGFRACDGTRPGRQHLPGAGSGRMSMDIALAWTDERRIALFRIDGPQVLQPAAERIAAAIEAAADAGAKGLVVDFKDIEGIDPPDLAMRQIVVRRWAEAARSRLNLAMVVREDFIDPSDSRWSPPRTSASSGTCSRPGRCVGVAAERASAASVIKQDDGSRRACFAPTHRHPSLQQRARQHRGQEPQRRRHPPATPTSNGPGQ